MSILARFFDVFAGISARLLVAAPLLLCGCNPFGLLAPDSSEIQTKHTTRHGYRAPVHPLYCYETLGDAMCYQKPLIAPHERLTGHYGPEPHHYTDACVHTSPRVLNDHYVEIPAY